MMNFKKNIAKVTLKDFILYITTVFMKNMIANYGYDHRLFIHKY